MNKQNLVRIASIAVIILAFGCALYFGYYGYEKKQQAVKQEIEDMRAQLTSLNELAVNEQLYVSTIDNLKASTNKAVNSFGVGITPEKTILRVNEIERVLGISIPNISFGEQELLFSSTLLPVNQEFGVYLYNDPVTLSFQAEYMALKSFIDYINAFDEKTGIEKITLAFNPINGKIDGTIILNQYTILGTEREYEPPVVQGRLGVENIFSTGSGMLSFGDGLENLGADYSVELDGKRTDYSSLDNSDVEDGENTGAEGEENGDVAGAEGEGN